MADNSENSGSDTTLSFKVKTSGDKSHTITMLDSATVLDLKTKLAGEDFENIPVERQRLIYSGRVMKNDDTLSTYKIKPGNTIHMVKSAASNPTPPTPSSSTAAAPQAIPQNMAAGTAANNLLAGLTGARFAGHANLPSRDLFGADGGMGAMPDGEQMADMLANPAIAQSMNEVLNNPAFVDYMIQNNPMLANMPNAREMLQSPYFRQMMTNPEAIRMASRMRRMMGGEGEVGAFPAPGVTDNTPAGVAANAGDGNTGAGGAAQPQNPFGFPGLFGAGDGAGAGAGASPFAAFANAMLADAQRQGSNPASPAAAGQATPSPQAGSNEPGQQSAGAAPSQSAATPSNPRANPFAALFGGLPGAGAGAGGTPAQNATQNPFGLGPVTPEMMQQAMQLWGVGGPGGFGSPSPASPPDNRPPEERYADQLRQLNDMGFYDFDRNVAALRRSGGSVQGAVEYLLSSP